MKTRKPKLLDAAGLFSYAVKALSVRALTQGELNTKLKARAERAADVDGVVFRLKQYGYIDDRRFAETFSRLRRDNDGFGKLRVLRDLRSRRVAPALAEQAVAQAYREADESELIAKFLERKLRRASGPPPAIDNPRKLASLYRMLLRAGFASGKILEALRKLPAQPEWVDGLESAAEEEVSD